LTIHISQSGYTRTILEQFDMSLVIPCLYLSLRGRNSSNQWKRTK